MQSSRHDVENAQRRVDDLDREIKNVNRAIDRELWYNCPPLIAGKAGLAGAQAGATAALQVVRGVFYAAEAVVHGSGFVAAEGLIGTAEVTLDGVREVKTAALNVTNDSLEEIRNAQNALISETEEALLKAETLSEELCVFDKAKELLADGERLAQSGISGAQTAVDGMARRASLLPSTPQNLRCGLRKRTQRSSTSPDTQSRPPKGLPISGGIWENGPSATQASSSAFARSSSAGRWPVCCDTRRASQGPRWWCTSRAW